MQTVIRFSAALLVLVTIIPVASSQVYIAGSIRGVLPDTTYIITNNLQVAINDTCTISPGAEFYFDGDYDFEIYGYLIASGTETDSIYFSPNTGVEAFGSIIFRDSANDASVFSYAVITGANGSAINAYYCDITIAHCTIVDNGANWGGGIYFSNANGIISDCYISDNTAIHNGGGIYCTGSAPVIENCTVVGNYSNLDGGNGSGRGGGGICANHMSSATIRDCIVDDNITEANGGGIAVNDNSHVIITDCTMNGNTADSSGGGLFISLNCTPVIENCEINQNVSHMYGGGIHLEDFVNASFDSCYVNDNLALFDGGGIALFNCRPSFNRCEVVSNVGVNGGGIYLSDADSTSLDQMTLSINTALGEGGNIFADSSNFAISNSIVEGALWGGGIYFAGGEASQVNYCDFANNISNNFNGTYPPGIGYPTTTNYNGDPCDDNFNIYLDPLFVNPLLDNFQLQEGSPCINAGDPLAPYDPDNTYADIGMHYFDVLGIEGSFSEKPQDYQVVSCYPNPFNPTTAISFQQSVYSHVSLKVYDVQGREVVLLVDGYRSAGSHEVTFDGAGLASGIYIYRFRSGGQQQSGKLILMK
ncbi:MAG: right-handed parallel beta-helix repeat-containing protein [bacterium]